jgi:hypothetical protein
MRPRLPRTVILPRRHASLHADRTLISTIYSPDRKRNTGRSGKTILI